MEEKHTLAMLSALARIELDSSRCYGEAVKNMKSPEKERLAGFLVQHDAHVDRITGLLRTMGQLAPVSLSPGGVLFTSGMRQVSEKERPLRVLEDMAANERMLISQYMKEQSPALGEKESELIDRHLSEEHEHLRYLEERIRTMKKEGSDETR